MAEVFLGMQEGLGGFEKLVVVKRIFRQFCEDENFVRMFLDEARLAASIRHQNVVQILDKMRVSFDRIAVRVEGDRRSDPPRRYTAIRLMYEVGGVAEQDAGKLRRAVDLSKEKYCSVLHSMRPDTEFSIRIELD